MQSQQHVCYIFAKHGIQGYQIWHSCVSWTTSMTSTQITTSNTKYSSIVSVASIKFSTVKLSYMQSPKVWSNFPPYKIIKQATICQLSLKTLPEAQRTQGIESLTQIITHGKNYSRGEMKYMSDYKNQAWSLKLEKSSVRTISLCPLFGDHLFHLVHLPVVLLVHHHLNDNHHLPK